MEPAKGQYWSDNDPRVRGMRIVQVVDVRGDQVRIKTVVQRIGGRFGSGYTTWTDKSRFVRVYTFMPANPGVTQ